MSDLVSEDDARDLRLSKAGDHDAFGRLHDRHAAVVLSVCRHAGLTLAEAEDACQETFIRAYGKLDNFTATPPRSSDRDASSPTTSLRSWLCAIARHVSSERRRAASRRLHHEGAASDMISHASLQSSRATVADHAPDAAPQLHDQLEQLSAALDHLQDDERLAIHLYYLDADPVAAAKAAMNLSRSGYYKLLARARQRLASLMQPAATVQSIRT